MESSQLASANHLKMPTWNQRGKTSACGSPTERDFSQNSRAPPREATACHSEEPHEPVSTQQQVVSADLALSPAGSPLMELHNPPKICLPHSQNTQVPGTQETVYTEGYSVKTQSGFNTLVMPSSAQCESERNCLADIPAALWEGPADQDPSVHPLVAWLCDDTVSGSLGMPPTGDHTSDYSQQLTTGDGRHLPLRGSQRTGHGCRQAHSPNQSITSHWDQACLAHQQRNGASADDTSHWHQMADLHEDKAVYEQQETDGWQQINLNGPMTSSSGPSVWGGEQHTLSEYQASVYRGGPNVCVGHQMTCPTVAQPLDDGQMPYSSLDRALQHGSKWTESSLVENPSWHQPKTNGGWEEPLGCGQMETSVHQNVPWGQKPSQRVEEHQDPQMIALSLESPCAEGSSYPSSSLLDQRQTLDSLAASPLVQGQLPQTNSDLHTQSLGLVCQERPGSLKPYLCPHPGCGKSYTKRHHVKVHARTHSGEKPYVCNHPGCPWKFSSSSDLRRHERRHSREQPFPCPNCNKAFSRLSYLKRHHQSVHT